MRKKIVLGVSQHRKNFQKASIYGTKNGVVNWCPKMHILLNQMASFSMHFATVAKSKHIPQILPSKLIAVHTFSPCICKDAKKYPHRETKSKRHVGVKFSGQKVCVGIFWAHIRRRTHSQTPSLRHSRGKRAAAPHTSTSI